MRVGKVIGQVVCSIKDPSLEGLRLLIVQGLDDQRRAAGKPFVAVDAIRCAGPGDVVFLALKRDAAVALGDKPPVDAAILGYVDELAAEAVPGGPLRIWKPQGSAQ